MHKGFNYGTGKGRVHCKPESVVEINGNALNSHGCVEQPTGAVAYPECTPSAADYEVRLLRNLGMFIFHS